MKESIESALRQLVGLPLIGSRRAADIQMFSFGRQRTATNRLGELRVVSDFALHITCAWRIVEGNRIVVASADVLVPAGNPEQEPPNFDLDVPGANRRDNRLAALLEEQKNSPLVVETIEADSVGSVHMGFSHKFVLDIFPDHSTATEWWRLFRPGTSSEHFVVSGTELG